MPYSKLKHIAMDLHFVLERTEQGTLMVRHILGNQQLSHLLTKSLRPKPFHELQGKLVEPIRQV